jgi:hypothetical protein
MRFMKIIGASALAACTGDLVFAAHPPLDRPTPPPCCADGICYPKVDTWGWYQTQWRRWPGVELEPTPAAKAPGETELKPYEPLPPELEDRRAPPPTKSRSELTEEGEAPPEQPLAPPPGGGLEPPRPAPSTTAPGGPLTTPPESPFRPEPSSPFSPEPTRPFSPEPSTPQLAPPPTTPMPWETGNEPTGDWDPPPTLPSATAVTVDRAPVRQTPDQIRKHAPARPPAPPQQRPGNDPPPALPVTLASANYY